MNGIHDTMQPSSIALYHGSSEIVRQPLWGKGNPHNDYGLGFYCTEDPDLAREWACPSTSDGYVNAYRLDPNGLRTVDVNAAPYGTLHWIGLLVRNRRFNATTPLAQQAKEFLISNYEVDLHDADLVVGYRADDSYFSFARTFLDNRISISQLERALALGNPGRQIVLKSPRAFEALSFVESEPVDATIWHPRRITRDRDARKQYAKLSEDPSFDPHDLFMLDLMRGA